MGDTGRIFWLCGWGLSGEIAQSGRGKLERRSAPAHGHAKYAKHYKHLRLLHGVVTHQKEEWAVVKRVRIFESSGASRWIKLKHGTEVADGTWSKFKNSYSSQVKSSAHERLAEYIKARAWRARRHGQDLFTQLGRQKSSASGYRLGGTREDDTND